jgi:hypothetical protein
MCLSKLASQSFHNLVHALSFLIPTPSLTAGVLGLVISKAAAPPPVCDVCDDVLLCVVQFVLFVVCVCVCVCVSLYQYCALPWSAYSVVSFLLYATVMLFADIQVA